MRLLRVTTHYPEYLHHFYRARPGLDREPYAVQRARLDEDFFGWADSWGRALAPLGWETLEVALNADSIQRAWARENLHGSRSRNEIVVEQSRAFRPDIVWYDHHEAELLRRIREAAPTIRGVAGYSGSAVSSTEAWPLVDLMLSCAPEVVERCRHDGMSAAVLSHAFDPRVLERLDLARSADGPSSSGETTFIGQLIDGEGFHGRRLQLLAELAARTPLTLYVPKPRRPWRTGLRRLLSGKTLSPLPPALRGSRDGTYGMAMYQVLRGSRATLNIHADSSPRYASNMRLFEATGIGTCLITDAKENLHTFFDPGREVLPYRDAAECAEIIRRLSDHPEEARQVAAGGQRRTLEAHTFAHRAPALDEHLRGLLR